MNLREAYEDLHRSQEAREGRVYYSVVGSVTDIEDPTSGNFLGRVKARFASQGDNESTDWLSPMWQGGIESVPRKGDQVLVSFQDGDPHRGYYSWHPDKSTKNRASEWAVLGLTFAGMHNDAMDKMTTLISKYNAVVADLSTLSTLLGTTGLTVSGGLAKGTFTPTATTDSDSVGKIQKADGSTVASSGGDQKALSGRVKIQI